MRELIDFAENSGFQIDLGYFSSLATGKKASKTSEIEPKQTIADHRKSALRLVARSIRKRAKFLEDALLEAYQKDKSDRAKEDYDQGYKDRGVEVLPRYTRDLPVTNPAFQDLYPDLAWRAEFPRILKKPDNISTRSGLKGW
jgi:hypothetical protein